LLTISADSPDLGTAKAEMEIKFKGEQAISFNEEYFLDPLNTLTEDNIVLEVIVHVSPDKISTESGDYLCIVMPMRMPEETKPAKPAKSIENTTKPAPAPVTEQQPEPEGECVPA